ncbi:hypothetical protein [Pseudomonas fluorescens]|uniref:hypothetical protein n=1 Tax=Pseudomonas fluorescens TaxID=294 RepID=UPI003F79A671
MSQNPNSVELIETKCDNHRQLKEWKRHAAVSAASTLMLARPSARGSTWHRRQQLRVSSR